MYFILNIKWKKESEAFLKVIAMQGRKRKEMFRPKLLLSIMKMYNDM